MKRKSILFSVLSVLCIGMAAGCGETKYAISVKPTSNEYGRVTGGGNYAKGATVNINVYPSLGCTPSNLIFTKNGETSGVEIAFTSNQEEYSVYQFAVNDDTIGSYVANFTCSTAFPGDDEERVLKYKVTYDLKVDGASVIVVDNPDEEGALEDNVEEIQSGKKVTPRYYIDGVDGKIAWYTQDVSSLEESQKAQYLYDFTKILTGNITLYGEVMDMSEAQIVQEAIDNFKNSAKLKIVNGEETATIVDFNKEIKDVKITVNTSEGIKSILQKGSYYIYKGTSNKAGIALNSDKISNSFDLNEINDIYKFIELKDIIASEYTVTEVTDLSEEDRTVGTTICKVYALKESAEATDVFMKVYVHNGVVYKVVKGESVNVIEYGDAVATQVDGAKDMFFVRLYSDNTTLNATLNDMNGNFETITKIVPAYGETLKDILEDNESILFNLLKRYDYSWYRYQNGECSNVEYTFNSIITNHVDVCAKVNASIDSVESALERFTAGNYDVITSIKIFDGELETRYNSIGADVNLFETATKPDGMNNATWNTITSLRDLMSTYYSFDYDASTNEYKFFKSKTDLFNPYLIVKLNSDNTLIEKVTYFAGYTEDGDRNTYTSEFIYPTISSSVNANVEYIEENYYNKEVGFDFATVADLDDHFYTFVSYVDEVSKVKLGEDVFDNSVVRFSVGNNNFIERPVWKVVGGKLYVSSAILKSYMLTDSDGKLLVETLNTADETTYSVTISFDLAGLGASPLTDVSGSSVGILDGFNYTSSNGKDSIRIKFGNDASLADVSVFTINDKDGVRHFAYTKLDKIGEDYYLVLYPEYSSEGYSEGKSFTYGFVFVASNGAFGSYTFNVTLTETVA